jgi:hypothetical protein
MRLARQSPVHTIPASAARAECRVAGQAALKALQHVVIENL